MSGGFRGQRRKRYDVARRSGPAKRGATGALRLVARSEPALLDARIPARRGARGGAPATPLDIRGAELDLQLVDAVRARRSDRIALYTYRFGPTTPPPPPVDAVRSLLEELRRRSHLVLMDGLDDPDTRSALLAATDKQVLVIEPTPGGASRAVRLLEFLGDGPRPLIVRSHTRAFANGACVRALRRAGLHVRPRVSVPFDPTVPAMCDRGRPKDRVPRSLEKPLAAMTDQLLAHPGVEEEFAGLRAEPVDGAGPQSQQVAGRTRDEAPRRRSALAWWPRPRSTRPRPA